METGKSRLYLPEDVGRSGGRARRPTGPGRRRGSLSTVKKQNKTQKNPASAAAVISIPSYCRYNEECV